MTRVEPKVLCAAEAQVMAAEYRELCARLARLGQSLGLDDLRRLVALGVELERTRTERR